MPKETKRIKLKTMRIWISKINSAFGGRLHSLHQQKAVGDSQEEGREQCHVSCAMPTPCLLFPSEELVNSYTRGSKTRPALNKEVTDAIIRKCYLAFLTL